MDARGAPLGRHRRLDPARRWVQWEGNYERNLCPRAARPARARRRASLWTYIDVYDLAARAAAGGRARDARARGRSTSPRPTTAPAGRCASWSRHHYGDEIELRELDREDASGISIREGRASCSATHPTRSWRDYLTDDGELRPRRRERLERERDRASSAAGRSTG